MLTLLRAIGLGFVGLGLPILIGAIGWFFIYCAGVAGPEQSPFDVLPLHCILLHSATCSAEIEAITERTGAFPYISLLALIAAGLTAIGMVLEVGGSLARRR